MSQFDGLAHIVLLRAVNVIHVEVSLLCLAAQAMIGNDQT